MDEVLENLREFKVSQEVSISSEEKVIDVSYYGKINLSKNDSDINNEKKEDLYLVKKEVNGKIELEFYTNNGVIAVVGKEGQIKINEAYKELINDKEFLLQLEKVMPLSLAKLEELEKKRNQEKSLDDKQTKQENTKEESKINEPKQYIENPKDAKIDMNKKITETKTFSELVPEVKEKGIIDVRARRIDNTKFELIGINKEGQEIQLETLKQTEGTNPNKDIIEVSGDGSRVKQNQVMTILKIKNGENQGKQDEGFTVNLGEYGIPEVNYYRRAKEENEYTSIPVNLQNTNQKITDKDVREYIEKKRNTSVEDNITKAEDRIEYNEDKETELENIDDDPHNDKIVDEAEMLIRKAAARCKMEVESFKKELEKADGEDLEEKIENTEEAINEQFRGNSRNRA